MGASAEGNVKITVKAEDKTGGAFGSAFKNIEKLGKAAGTAVLGATVIAGAAIAGVATKGIMEFVKFEDSLNEVFTLLPGISGVAMRDMEKQVLDTSVAMGRMPDEIIPALYQSLSAGVPADNVFEFMETAHQASLGGVTELTTAVDGITSVINAYGSDVVSATEASDIMFTAVRLGKTDFNQLSSSLFNVIPTAASLGVSFGDVSATLATLTGQGTPTSVATTQIRAALVEASKGGTKLDSAIQGLTGSSFPELIKQGESMPSIFESLRSSMSDQEFKDLFGSVEAVNAVLGITGPNFEKVESAMDEMNSSAGATTAAYDVMNSGMARTFEVLKARAATTFIKVGKALAPLVEMLGEKLFGALDKIMPIIEQVLGVFDSLFSGIQFGEEPLASIKFSIMDLMEIFGFGQSDIDAFGEAFDNTRTFIENLIPQILEVKNKIVEFLEPIVAAVLEFVSWKDILIALAAVIGVVVISAIISLISAIAPILAIIAVVIGVIALLRNAWESNFLGIQDKTKLVMDFIKEKIETVVAGVTAFWAENGEAILAKAQEIWDTILEVIDFVVTEIMITVNLIMTALREFWEENGETILSVANTIWTAIRDFITTIINTIRDIVVAVATAIKEFWDAYGAEMLGIAEAFWESIKVVFDTVLAVIGEIFDAFKSAFEGDWEAFGEKLRDAWDLAWEAIKEIIQTIGDAILEFIRAMVDDIVAKFTETDWGKLGEDLIMGVKEGVVRKAKKLLDAVVAALRAAWQAATAFLRSKSPSKLFEEVGGTIPEGLAMGIDSGAGTVMKSIGAMLKPNVLVPGGGITGGSSGQVVNNFNNQNTITASYATEQKEGRIIDDLRIMQMLRD